jgi:type IV pilus assembly protein PilP
MIFWGVVVILIAGGAHHLAGAAASDADKQAPVVGYVFNPAGKPDPFRPFVEKDPVIKQKKEMAAAAVPSIFPLQRVGLDQFYLIGIAGTTERRLAVVETRDAKGSRFYALTLGTIIGLNNGKVAEIGNDQIVVEEATPGRTGKKINRIIKKLRKDEEGIQ